MKKRQNSISTVLSLGILLLALLTSCTARNAQIVEFDNFPAESKVIAKELQWDDCGIPMKVLVYDTLVVVVEDSGEHFAYFFNTANNSLLGSALKKGKGPGEFSSSPWLLNQFIGDEKDLYITMVDQGRRERITLAVFQTISSGSAVISKRKKLSDRLPDPIVYELNDSIVVGTDKWAEKSSLFIFNENSQTVVSVSPKVPFKNFSLLKDDFQEWLNISPNREYFVGNFNDLKLFTIYNRDGELKHIVRFTGKINPVEVQSMAYYEDTHLSNELIYIVNTNRIPGLVPVQPNKSEVLVFNYSGRPVKRFLLDRTIMRTAMDFVHNRLYGYDVVEMTYVYFDLGKL